MSNLPEGITQVEIETYSKIDLAIKKLEPRKKELGDRIKAAYTKVGSFVVGNVIIDRTEADSKDIKSAEKLYPYDLYPELYVVEPKFDFSKLAPEEQAKFVTKTQRLSVKVSG